MGGNMEFKDSPKENLALPCKIMQLLRKVPQLHAGEFVEKVKLWRAGGERRKSGTLASQLQ